MSALEVQKAVIVQSPLRLSGSPGQCCCSDIACSVDIVSESLSDCQEPPASCFPFMFVSQYTLRHPLRLCPLGLRNVPL